MIKQQYNLEPRFAHWLIQPNSTSCQKRNAFKYFFFKFSRFQHEISNHMVCATSKGSDQRRPLSLEYSMTLRPLTNHHLEFLSSKSSCPHMFKMPHVMAQIKYGCKYQDLIQSSTTADPRYQWESDKLTVRHRKREPRGQPFQI